MATYTHSYELDHTTLQEWDTVFIGWHKGTVVHNYISFDTSHLWHKAICDTFDDIHGIAYAVYQDTSTISSSQQFPTFTNTHDATAIVRVLMRRYNKGEPHPGIPMFATEAGPVYDGQASCGSPMSATEADIRATKIWSSVSYSEKITSEPVSEKKKSRIVFPKIR